MSVDQLRQAIPTLAAEVPAERHNRTNFERKIQERLLRAMHAFLERGGEASAIGLWSWLTKIPTQHLPLELAQGRSLGDLPREALLCALAGCRWGLYSQERFGTSGLEETLTLLLFTETREPESFIRDTLEPFLFSGAEHVSGLHQVTHKEAFADLIAALAMEWLDKSESMSARHENIC